MSYIILCFRANNSQPEIVSHLYLEFRNFLYFVTLYFAPVLHVDTSHGYMRAASDEGQRHYKSVVVVTG
jgi:hypothetical protein